MQHRILSRTVFLSVLQSIDRYQLEKHYLYAKSSFFWSKEISVRQNFYTNPRGRSLSPNLPSAYCIASHFMSNLSFVCQSCKLFSYGAFKLPLVSYFRRQPFNPPSVHAFDELFSSRPFNSPSGHSFGELFSSPPFDSLSVHPFGKLFFLFSSIHSRSFGHL